MSTNATLSATESPSEAPIQSDDYLRLLRRTRRLTVLTVGLAVLVLAAIGAGIFLYHRLNAVDKAQKDVAFDEFIDSMNATTDFVQPTVNTIQFMHHGYSITFDKVEYNQNGLLLSGQVGKASAF